MRIPWVPLTSGAGAYGPAIPKPIFMADYSTGTNPVSHKAFQNLPMYTDLPAVRVEEPNPKGKFQQTKARPDGEGAGENYVDSFVLHPVKGNYVDILKRLEIQREETRRDIEDGEPYPTLLTLVEQGYTNIGRSPDEEFQNSVRDKLRQAGASDEEVEVILKEARMKRLKEAAVAKESAEQRQRRMTQELADSYTRLSAGMGASRRTKAPFDANVYSFGTPAPVMAGLANLAAEPGSGVFASGVVRGRARGPGPGRRSVAGESTLTGTSTTATNAAGLPAGVTDFASLISARGRPIGTMAERALLATGTLTPAQVAAAAEARKVQREARAGARSVVVGRAAAGPTLAERLESL